MSDMKTGALLFFFEHAGTSYPAGASEEVKALERVKGAQALARAEHWAWEQGYTFDWSQDHCDSSEWSDELPAYPQWNCAMRAEHHGCVASLGCVDFGRDVEPWGQSYKRVVESELALERAFELNLDFKE